MTLITRLIDEHNAVVQYVQESHHKDGFLDGMKKAIEIARNHNGWISVDDMLPSDEDWVLATNGTEIEIVGISVSNDGEIRWIRQSDFYPSSNLITHWQPLPQPPKE